MKEAAFLEERTALNDDDDDDDAGDSDVTQNSPRKRNSVKGGRACLDADGDAHRHLQENNGAGTAATRTN